MTLAPASHPLPEPRSAQGPRARWRRHLGWIALAVILTAAALLRTHDLTRHALWSDEIYTLETSAGFGLESKWLNEAGLLEEVPDLLSITPDRPWWTVATTLARDDNHPPLYFLLVRLWRHAFGDGDAALRSFSVACSVGAIALLYDAARHLHGVGPALWAALLMSVAIPQIQFAQEGRAYALMLLLGMGACAAIVRIERLGPSPWRYAALLGCILALLLTHYYAIAPAAALVIYAIARLTGPPRRRTLLALAGAAALFAVLWGWAMWRQRLNLEGNNWYIVETRDDHLAATVRRLLVLPASLIIEPRLSARFAASFAAVLYVIPFLLRRRRPDLLLWGLWLISIVALVLAVDLINSSKQLDFLRYSILASPAIYALIPAVTSRLKSRWLPHALPAATALSCVFGLPLAYEQTQTPKPDWRIHADVVQREAGDDEIILFWGSYPQDAGIVSNNYLNLRRYAPRTPRTVIFTAEPTPSPAVQEKLRQASGLWVVVPIEKPMSDAYLDGMKLRARSVVWGLPEVQHWTRVDDGPREMPTTRNERP